MRGLLGTGDIIFMILACAAPMGVLAGIIPLALAFGNGAGMPGTQLLVCIVMLLFAMGYVRMIPHVRNAGAFYAYIALSLNKEAGVAAACVAFTAYVCATASVLGAMAAGLIIAAITYLSLANYSALTGTDMVAVNSLPLLFAILIAIGLLHGFWLRRNRPAVYASIGSTQVEGDIAPTSTP